MGKPAMPVSVRTLALLLFVLPSVLVSAAPRSAIIVDIGSRGPAQSEEIRRIVEAEVRAELQAANRFGENYVTALRQLGLAPDGVPFSAPRVVLLRRNGRLLTGSPGVALGRGRGGDLVLQFRPDGHQNAFPASYRQLLQSVFNTARPHMNTIFGTPFTGGPVRVDNMDASIGDRDAVAGGIFLPDDGTGFPAIWFPIYNASETAAVNFIHTLYLAYMGSALFAFDAWSEGFARAATMATVRNPSALPAGLDMEFIEQIVEATYDVSAHYDWYNQAPLANDRFIAPNLKNLPLPPGGSLGGIYLMRYMMAGTAWAKVLIEWPGFLSVFLQQYYADPSIGGNVPALVALAQDTLNFLNGGPGATVEGLPFAEWYRRQYVLNTTVSRGKKAFVQAIPITFGLGGNDFGVFAIWLTYFETAAGGNEVLLSGTSFPIYWDSTFARLFTTGQDDRMDIAAAFGSVTPNLPDVFNVGSGPTQWYRATIDLPVLDQVARAVVPAGAVATAQNPTPKNFYGTVIGFDGAKVGGDPNVSGKVRLTVLPGGNFVDAPLRNGAFGVETNLLGSTPVRVRVDVIPVFNNVEQAPVHTELVNVWGDRLGLVLHLNEFTTYSVPGGLSAGVQAVGFPVRPFEMDTATLLGLPPSQTLVARWKQERFDYERWPSLEPFDVGEGFYVRMPSAAPGFQVSGRRVGMEGFLPVTVALQPGWNQIVNPFPNDISFSDLTVQRAADFPTTWSGAISSGWIGPDVFQFTPGSPDPHSGIPEGGTLSPINFFPAGRAVFVRVLVSEGLSITFRPGVLSPTQDRGRRWWPSPTWKGSLTIWGYRNEQSSVEVGQATNHRRGVDAGVDSEMPPMWGGAIQAFIASAVPLYRDIQAPSEGLWDVVVTGLRPGHVYRATFRLSQGSNRNILRLALEDVDGRRSYRILNGWTITFRARAETHRLRLRNGGVR
jgi:hypothetical protein